MGLVKNFRADHKKALNSKVVTFRKHQKEIEQLKKIAQFDKPSSMCGVAAKYHISYKTVRGHILGA